MIVMEWDELPELLLNARMGWRKSNRIKHHWYDVAAILSKPHLPPKPYDRAWVSYIRRSTTEPDAENLASGFKFLQDGFVRAGLFVDDNPRVLEAHYAWERAKRGQGGIRVEVLPILRS